MSARRYARILTVAAGLASVVGVGQASFSASVGTGTYQVQAGDSLWRIANEDGTTVDALAAANGLSPNGILQIGVVLTIPSAGSSSSVTTLSSDGDGDGDGDSTTTAAAAVVSAPASPTGSFCQTFTPEGGPQGVLPALLDAYPDRLALRPLFVEWADHYGVSPALVEAIAWQESGWQQDVVSSASAIGVGQLIPSTAQFVQNDLVGETLDVTSTSDNIRMSAAFLAYLSRDEGGNLCSTIAAYYEGPLNLSEYGVFSMTVPYVESVEALLPRFE